MGAAVTFRVDFVGSFLRPPALKAAFAAYEAGTLDDAAQVKPGAFIFTRSKLPWVALPPEIPAFEIYYDMASLWPAESQARRAAALAG